MDGPTISNIILTAAITLFAGLTWRVTRSYARLTGLTLFLQHFEKVTSQADNAFRRASIDALKIIREEFPDIYSKMQKHVGAETRKQIEGS